VIFVLRRKWFSPYEFLISFASVEYTDMARHARSVMTANGVDNIVTVLQGAVEDIELPIEQDNLNPEGPIDIMIR
jgi:hypothetical protein